LFTMEGIIRAFNRANAKGLGFTTGVIHHAYYRWADTQIYTAPISEDGWLIQQQWLYAQRAPGKTCMDALAGGTKAVEQFGHRAVNDSKGCGGVMRSAPFGWLSNRENHEWIYEQACEAAGYTHGHPTGKVASGALAYLIANSIDGQELPHAVASTIEFLKTQQDSQETVVALVMAVHLAEDGNGSRATLETLGAGWIAEEALAISVCAALCFPSKEQAIDALSLSVSHGGDSDSTGSICGNILGAHHGENWLPAELTFQLEGRGTMLELADDFIYSWRDGYTPKSELIGIDTSGGPDSLNDLRAWWDRYPGW